MGRNLYKEVRYKDLKEDAQDEGISIRSALNLIGAHHGTNEKDGHILDLYETYDYFIVAHYNGFGTDYLEWNIDEHELNGEDGLRKAFAKMEDTLVAILDSDKKDKTPAEKMEEIMSDAINYDIKSKISGWKELELSSSNELVMHESSRTIAFKHQAKIRFDVYLWVIEFSKEEYEVLNKDFNFGKEEGLGLVQFNEDGYFMPVSVFNHTIVNSLNKEIRKQINDSLVKPFTDPYYRPFCCPKTLLKK